jgi:CheY-like chemotaxis protein
LNVTSSIGNGRQVSTILLVEDESSLRDVVASVLEDEGFSVMLAVDGRHAMQLLTRRVPHLVVTDVRMPRMDGRELVSAMRASAELSSIPVVMISAVAPADSESLNIQGFVAKPFDFDELLETIRDLLNHR